MNQATSLESLFADYLAADGFPEPRSAAAAKAERLIRAIRSHTAATASVEKELLRALLPSGPNACANTTTAD